MISGFTDLRLQQFGKWWRAPLTPKDRVMGAIVGATGCLWIGVLGRLALGPTPVSLVVIGWWALGSIAVGVALGVAFPKATTCVCFPFSTFGIGGGT